MIALLGLTAWAQQDADACNISIGVATTIPAHRAVNVPVDVVPTLIFREECGAGGPIWHAILTDADGTALYDDFINAQALVAEGLPVGQLALGADLLPNADYTLTLTADGGYYDPEPQILTFRTGTQAFGGLRGEPTIEVSSADWFEDGGNLILEGVANGAASEGTLSALFVPGPDGVINYVSALGPVDVTLVSIVADPPDEACATVMQLDAAAEVHSAEACMAVTVIPGVVSIGSERSGCACQPEAGVADTGLFIVLIGPLVGLVRRRRRR